MFTSVRKGLHAVVTITCTSFDCQLWIRSAKAGSGPGSITGVVCVVSVFAVYARESYVNCSLFW
jgi:hypothetical protein